MSLIHGVILAGGKGERLGGARKGDLRVGGCRLVERVAAALGPTSSPLMVSVGSWRLDGMADGLAVADLPADMGGPLAGIAAAVASLQERGISAGLMVSAAVDTPFLPPDFSAVMGQKLGGRDAAYAVWGVQFYPPNAIWRLEALQDLPDQLHRGAAPRSVRALHEALGARSVDWAERCAANPFANVNTLADLLALEAQVMHTAGK